MRKSQPILLATRNKWLICRRLFASLASDKNQMVPYSREIADQRRKYGDIMLRKSEEHLAAQRQFEAEAQAKLDAARQKRQEERERQEALEVRFGIYIQTHSHASAFVAREDRSIAQTGGDFGRRASSSQGASSRVE